MPHDRTGEPIEDDSTAPTMFGRPDRCDRCDHGWIESFYDAEGTYLGGDRGDPDYRDLVASERAMPCPRCKPKEYLRWERGCTSDPTHNYAACELCQEDGRRAPRI